jgi:hypothetical protein
MDTQHKSSQLQFLMERNETGLPQKKMANRDEPQFTGVVSRSAGLKHNAKTDEPPHSKIPSIFEHTAHNSSTIESNYHQPRYHRGRKPGRVLASQYGEVVVDELYPGNTILLNALPSLIKKAELVLNLTSWRRKHTLIRIDAGGGTVTAINELLSAGYAVVTKDYVAQRASRLVQSVQEWMEDPDQPGRWAGCQRKPMSMCVRSVGWRCALKIAKASGTVPCCSLLG